MPYKLGHKDNIFKIVIADFYIDSNKELQPKTGFTNKEAQTIAELAHSALPIMRKLWGPPAIPTELLIVADQTKSATAFYRLPGYHRIHLGAAIKRIADDGTIIRKIPIINLLGLLMHEWGHAYRCGHVLSQESGKYDVQFDSFEESLAQAQRYQIRNAMLKEYGTTFHYRAEPKTAWWDDYQASPSLSTEAIWSDQGALGLAGARYEIGGWQIMKILQQDKYFIRNFHRAYFSWCRDHYRKKGSWPIHDRKDLIKLFEKAFTGRIEGKKMRDFLKHPIFAAQIMPGLKIFVESNYTKRNDDMRMPEFLSRNKIAFYETSKRGNDWINDDGEKWAHGDKEITVDIYHSGGLRIFSDGNYLTPKFDGEPIRFGKYRLWLTSAEESRADEEAEYYDNLEDDWTHAPFIKKAVITERGLYRIDIRINDTSGTVIKEESIWRVLGDLKNFEGIAMGVRDGKDGDRVKIIDLNRRNRHGRSLAFHGKVVNGLALLAHPLQSERLERIERINNGDFTREEKEAAIADIENIYTMAGNYRISYYDGTTGKRRRHIYRTLGEGYRNLNMILI